MTLFLNRATVKKQVRNALDTHSVFPISSAKTMQLYSRVFLQILDSSIAEDWKTRHVFEDFLKVAVNGIVDMTRQALSRRLNIPLDILNDCITKLESPDPHSRDERFEGRRIERLDPHRDWGWKILNWEKYEKIKNRVQANERLKRHRESRRLVEDEIGPEPPEGFNETPEPIEFPPHFPKNPDEAVKMCSVAVPGADKADVQMAIRRFWHEAAGVSGKDMRGRQITNWIHHVNGRLAHPNLILSKSEATAPKDAPPWQQLKAVESLLQDCDKKLKQITVPNHELFPEDYKKACALRTPIVEEKHRLAEQKRELTKLVASNGQKP